MIVAWRRFNLTRDSLIVFVSLCWGTYEIIFGEARPAVLALIGALIASPMVMRVDEALKREKEHRDTDK